MVRSPAPVSILLGQAMPGLAGLHRLVQESNRKLGGGVASLQPALRLAANE
jgi:hypothetical protein